MCGLVGRLGDQSARRVVEDLRTLEYRGYDSWGVAVVVDGALSIDKDTGSISKAATAGRFEGMPNASLALGHTRWATHGQVTRTNAHPHVSFDGRVAVVHNGVIQNHLALRRELASVGVEAVSETDTEVIAHLIALHLKNRDDTLEAIGLAIAQLEGEYALGILLIDEPHTLYGAKHKSPLILGWNGESAILASDPMVAGDVSSELLYLHDGDLFRLQTSGPEVRALDSESLFQPAQRSTTFRSESVRAPEKGRFDHYMLKEIYETPQAVATASALSAEELRAAVPSDTQRLTVIGSGSAFYVARIGQYFLNRLAGRSAHALPSDEAAYWATFDEDDAVIAISQSGETFDTLEVARLIVERGAHLTSVSNVPDSTLERVSNHQLRQAAGPEICVLSTKSVISQVVMLARMALRLAADSRRIDDAELKHHEESLRRLPDTLHSVIEGQAEEIRTLAERYSETEHWFFIGRGPLYPVALESALKFKEVSYRHAEGLPAGFFKHGTISLIDENFYTVALLPSKTVAPDRFHGTLANVNEIVARKGPVIAFGPQDMDEDDCDGLLAHVGLPFHDEDIADVVIQLVAGQLFAYYCALSLGREIDQPRSLAKSVTVR